MKNVILSLLLFLTFNTVVLADIAVVVHPDNSLSSASINNVSRIFLAKMKVFGNGEKIKLFDLEETNPLRTLFYQKVLNKSAGQVRAYWTQLIFTGKGKPPKVLLDSEEIVEAVGHDINSIGYVNVEAVNDSVKVLLTITE
ncbi:MAG: hypothetical protein JKY67_06120 [Pseudomonadales bacterium]|nr:hypothetical protein [Pseudomonadales bacterium]